jgi:hypothetical protein
MPAENVIGMPLFREEPGISIHPAMRVGELRP